MVICLGGGADCLHMVQLMPLHPETPSSLAPFKSRLVLPFWCRFTQVVLEKRPLNGCSSSSSILLLIVQHAVMCLFRYLELLSPVAWICSTVLLNVHLSMWGIFLLYNEMYICSRIFCTVKKFNNNSNSNEFFV